jgi:phage FluMu protein Com
LWFLELPAAIFILSISSEVKIMAIEFFCTSCGTRLRTPDESSGQRTKCPHCETIQNIPEPSKTMQTSSFDTGEWSGFESGTSADFRESGNPWQAPTDLGDERFYQPLGVTGSQLSFSQAYSMTFETLKSNFLPFFVFSIIQLCYSVAGFFVGYSISLSMLGDPNYLMIIRAVSVIDNILANFLTLGMSFCALELIRTGTTSFGTGFSILKRILSLIAFNFFLVLLVIGVVVLPIVVVVVAGSAIDAAGVAPIGMVIAVSVSVFWGIASAIIISCRLANFGSLLLVDQKVPVFRVFSLAWEMTKGNTSTIFGIFFVFGCIAFLWMLLLTALNTVMLFVLGLGPVVGELLTVVLRTIVLAPFVICLVATCYHILWEQYSARTGVMQVSEW